MLAAQAQGSSLSPRTHEQVIATPQLLTAALAIGGDRQIFRAPHLVGDLV